MVIMLQLHTLACYDDDFTRRIGRRNMISFSVGWWTSLPWACPKEVVTVWLVDFLPWACPEDVVTVWLVECSCATP